MRQINSRFGTNFPVFLAHERAIVYALAIAGEGRQLARSSRGQRGMLFPPLF